MSDKLQQVKEAAKMVMHHFPYNFYTKDQQKDFAIAYLMGMGWSFDEAVDGVYDSEKYIIH